MSDEKYKECQECKKVFKLPVSSRIFNQHACPFCGDWNTAYVNKEIYRKGYGNSMIK